MYFPFPTLNHDNKCCLVVVVVVVLALVCRCWS